MADGNGRLRAGVSVSEDEPEVYMPTHGGEVFEGENFGALSYFDGPTRGLLESGFDVEPEEHDKLNGIVGLMLRQIQAVSMVPVAVAQMASAKSLDKSEEVSTLSPQFLVEVIRDAIDIILQEVLVIMRDMSAVSKALDEGATPNVNHGFFPLVRSPNFTFKTWIPKIIDEGFADKSVGKETFLSPAASAFIDMALPRYRDVIVRTAMAFAANVYKTGMMPKHTFQADVGNPFAEDAPGKMPGEAALYSTLNPYDLAAMARRAANEAVVEMAKRKGGLKSVPRVRSETAS